jgi:hypothetical protein
MQHKIYNQNIKIFLEKEKQTLSSQLVMMEELYYRVCAKRSPTQFPKRKGTEQNS